MWTFKQRVTAYIDAHIPSYFINPEGTTELQRALDKKGFQLCSLMQYSFVHAVIAIPTHRSMKISTKTVRHINREDITDMNVCFFSSSLVSRLERCAFMLASQRNHLSACVWKEKNNSISTFFGWLLAYCFLPRHYRAFNTVMVFLLSSDLVVYAQKDFPSSSHTQLRGPIIV